MGTYRDYKKERREMFSGLGLVRREIYLDEKTDVILKEIICKMKFDLGNERALTKRSSAVVCHAVRTLAKTMGIDAGDVVVKNESTSVMSGYLGWIAGSLFRSATLSGLSVAEKRSELVARISRSKFVRVKDVDISVDCDWDEKLLAKYIQKPERKMLQVVKSSSVGAKLPLSKNRWPE